MKIPLARLIAQNTKRKSVTFQAIEPLKRDQDQLQRVYLRVVRHWEDARKRLNDVYAREYALQRASADYTPDSIDDVTAAINEEASWFDNVFLDLSVQITAWTETVEAWHRKRWAQIAQPFIPGSVSLDTMLTAGDVENTLEATLRGNLELIKDVNEQQRARMAGVLYRGLNERMPARDVAKELQAITKFGRSRSLLIASDQLQKLTSALDGERMQQAGITEFIWRHSGKLHPRAWHKARNGRRYNLRTRKSVDGDEIIPADDMPGVPIRCGCKKQSYLAIEGIDDDGDPI